MLNIILNYILPVIVCTILNMVLATLWYQPFLLGRAWSKLTGQSIDGPPEPKKLLVGFLCSLVLVSILYYLILLLGITGPVMGLKFALILGLGLVWAIGLPISVYNGQKVKLFLIDYTLGLLFLIVDMTILSLWIV